MLELSDKNHHNPNNIPIKIKAEGEISGKKCLEQEPNKNNKLPAPQKMLLKSIAH